MAKHQLTELAGGRARHHRAPSRRPVGRARVLDRRRLSRRADARAGVSHFIEHLLFKGSSRYSAQEIAELFDELGGELNAATSRETTVVYTRVAGRAPRAGARRDGRHGVPPRRSTTSTREREVVLEEIAMVDDNAARSRPRHRRGGRVRRASARAPGDRPRRRHLDGLAAGARRLPRGAPTWGRTSSLAAAGNVRHDEVVGAARGAATAQSHGRRACRASRLRRLPRARPSAS